MLRHLWAALVLHVALAATALPAAGSPAGEPVTVDGIAATLVRPAGATAAVLVLPGSGPTDRDGNSTLGIRTDMYKQLADGLAKAGIASLRYDKRGIGASRNGPDGKPVEEASLTLDTSAADAVALARWLARQPGIARVVLAGHSEGGLVALAAARQVEVDRIVLLATAGFPLGEVLRKQLTRQPLPEDVMGEIERVLGVLEKGGDPGAVGHGLERFFRASVQPFLRSALAIDPAALVKATARPVLVVGGGSDLQIGRFDFEALSTARPGIERHWEARLTHTLKAMADDDGAQVKAYTDPSLPVVPAVIERVVAFVTAR